MKSFMLIASSIFAVVVTGHQAQAWGGRGHAAICETAVYLVKEKGLKDYLKNKPQMMGHLCNMPDFYWRSLSPEETKLGNPAHFMDLEITGLKIADVPLDYKTIVETYTGKPNAFKPGAVIKDVPSEFGSMWWRADQFYRRFLTYNVELQAATEPKNHKEAVNDKLPYNKAAYEMVVSLGLMGHFVGDASMPYHNTSNYDGWENGHGGIHGYYEDELVSEFDGDLQARVLKEARAWKNPLFLKPKTPLEKMKALSEWNRQDIAKIEKLDPILKPSTVEKSVDGLEKRIPAERKPSEEAFKTFDKMIVKELASSSLVLAKLWDDAYVEAGRPKLASSKIYRYPLTVDFIPPDYLPKNPAPGPAPTEKK